MDCANGAGTGVAGFAVGIWTWVNEFEGDITGADGSEWNVQCVIVLEMRQQFDFFFEIFEVERF